MIGCRSVRLIVASILAISSAAVCDGDTHRVPEDFATIPLAIEAAVSGDRVIVAPGYYLYSEFILFEGKDIVVESASGPEVTVLEFSFGGVDFENGESNAARLEGFTIVGGNVAMVSTPSVVGNILIGGRVLISGGGPDPGGPIICGNSITGNVVWYEKGGGMRISAPAIVESNFIVGNEVAAPSPDAFGGGIWIGGGPVIVRNNLIAGNTITACCGSGGGVHIGISADVILEGNTIVGNDAFYNGGGIANSSSNDGLTIRDCIVYGNTASFNSQISLSSVGTPSISYSIVEGGYSGTEFLDVDPIFEPGPLGDYYLNVDGPAVDAGDPSTPLPMGTTRVDQFPDIAIADVGFHYPIDNEFLRGDCNADGSDDVSDAVFLLSVLFVPGADAATCKAACNTNGDTTLDISDAIYTLSWLFTFGAEPPAPYPDCGYDHSGSALPCAAYLACP